jgi:hypothetical protein
MRELVSIAPSLTSAPDVEDPMVILNLDISNTLGTLCTRLVLDVLSGKVSRGYACGINADANFETTVHDLKAYFGVFRLQSTRETIHRFNHTMEQQITSGIEQVDFKECPVQNRWTSVIDQRRKAD